VFQSHAELVLKEKENGEVPLWELADVVHLQSKNVQLKDSVQDVSFLDAEDVVSEQLAKWDQQLVVESVKTKKQPFVFLVLSEDAVDYIVLPDKSEKSIFPSIVNIDLFVEELGDNVKEEQPENVEQELKIDLVEEAKDVFVSELKWNGEEKLYKLVNVVPLQNKCVVLKTFNVEENNYVLAKEIVWEEHVKQEQHKNVVLVKMGQQSHVLREL